MIVPKPPLEHGMTVLRFHGDTDTWKAGTVDGEPYQVGGAWVVNVTGMEKDAIPTMSLCKDVRVVDPVQLDLAADDIDALMAGDAGALERLISRARNMLTAEERKALDTYLESYDEDIPDKGG